jgi:hypothetical protein
MTYHAGWNQVIVKLDPDYTESGNFILPEAVEHFSVTGTVTSVGNFGYHRDTSYRNEWTKFYRELPTKEVSEITPLEVGDRVIFSYFTKLHEDHFLPGNLLIVDRSLILGKGDPFVGINGYILVKMMEKDRIEEFGNFFIENDDLNNYGVGEAEGKYWYFRRYHAARLELDFHNTLTKRQSSLFAVKKEYAWPVTKLVQNTTS